MILVFQAQVSLLAANPPHSQRTPWSLRCLYVHDLALMLTCGFFFTKYGLFVPQQQLSKNKHRIQQDAQGRYEDL